MFGILVRVMILVLILIPLIAMCLFIFSIASKPTCDSGSAQTFPPATIKKFNWHGTGLVTFWLDDAWESQYNSGVVELMGKEGWVGAISVATGLLCTRHYMTWDQLRKLQDKGWETTSHSVSHICDPTKYDDQTIAQELLESKTALESRNFRADYFVIPCGYNRHVVPKIFSFAQKHYLAYRRAGEEINPLPVINPYNLRSFAVTDVTTEEDVTTWVNEAKKKKGWLIIVFHQIDNRKLRYNVSVDMLKKILMIVKNSQLPVVLPTQALSVGDRKTHRKTRQQ